MKGEGEEGWQWRGERPTNGRLGARRTARPVACGWIRSAGGPPGYENSAGAWTFRCGTSTEKEPHAGDGGRAGCSRQTIEGFAPQELYSDVKATFGVYESSLDIDASESAVLQLCVYVRHECRMCIPGMSGLRRRLLVFDGDWVMGSPSLLTSARYDPHLSVTQLTFAHDAGHSLSTIRFTSSIIRSR